LNTFYGNGSATSKSSPTSPFSNNFGLGFIGTSQQNLVENNRIGGNINGVYLGPLVSGNLIRRNIIVGNPQVQVANDYGKAIGADIRDLSPAGANSFEDNRCLTYAGSLESPPCPNIAKHDDDDREEREIAAFGRNRLAFPQARLVNAVFHANPEPLPNAAGAAAVVAPRIPALSRLPAK
jgi:hypothetical protein